MRFCPVPLDGVYHIRLEPHKDERGFFGRAFCQMEFGAMGLPTEIKQSNLSYNEKAGTLRGLHYQRAPFGEPKLVRVVRGAVYSVIVDLRKESTTFCQWYGLRLDDRDHSSVFIPTGLAHGFLTELDHSLVQYEMFAMYNPESASGIRYDDATFGIEWPGKVEVISAKDKAWPDFQLEWGQ